MPKKKFLRLSQSAEGDQPEISPEVFHSAKLGVGLLSDISEKLAPSMDELHDMLSKMMNRKGWSTAKAAAIMGIHPDAISKILKRRKCGLPSARVVWLMVQLDENPEMLQNPLFLASWGRSRGLKPKPEPVPRKERIIKPVRKTPRILLPESPWLYVNWAAKNSEVAKLVHTSERVARDARTRLRRFPRAALLRAFGAVGRIRQVAVLLRGIDRSQLTNCSNMDDSDLRLPGKP